ncbi:hypothetical protein GDO81_001916 [Engystomops pustulosus]|uniref:Peptidase S1 domain-containing protein n=2 Tax=Engystomops pustulosus TaxID=76066 RepID=A0AAV7DHU8_ENGPU|nr:hypothetical protein GDO81_001916 [Engystomops pustulosus]
MGVIALIQVLCLYVLYGYAGTEDIIGGKEVLRHSMPYMAFVQDSSSDNKVYRCGGVLISDDYVLTAAHCKTANMKVILGAHNIMVKEDTQEINVCNAIPHPQYQGSFEHDIMLLKLMKKAVINRYVLPLPTDNSNSNVKPGEICTVAGWGVLNTYNDKLSELLREVHLTVVDNKVCSTYFPKLNVADFICAGDVNENKVTGKGDSGGPLLCGVNLSGIVFGGKKNKKPPTLFTKVAPYKTWIKNTMKKEKCNFFA